MSPGAVLRLGRVSNLPTVWTNVLAGMVLAGGGASDVRLVPLLVAFTLFYVAGMFLNDWFDRGFDAEHRPDRPIPAGEAEAGAVLAAAVAMLAAGLALVAWAAFALGSETGPAPVAAALALVAAIVIYDRFHKENPLSPAVMAACRALVYIAAGLAVVAAPEGALWIGAAALFAYLVGLTHVAKQETLGRMRNLWPLVFLAGTAIVAVVLATMEGPGALLLAGAFVLCLLAGVVLVARQGPGDLPRAVVILIAGISLLDGVLIASAGAPGLGLLAAGGFVATLALQRLASGT